MFYPACDAESNRTPIISSVPVIDQHSPESSIHTYPTQV